MNRTGSTYHHSPLAGVSAGATAVLASAVLVLVAARRQLGEVATVVVWAVVATVVGAVIAAAVYVVLWLRHRVLHPETLARRQLVRAEVVNGAAGPQAVGSAVPRPAIEAPRNEVHLHFHTAELAEAAAIIRQAIPGTAGNAITEEEQS